MSVVALPISGRWDQQARTLEGHAQDIAQFDLAVTTLAPVVPALLG